MATNIIDKKLFEKRNRDEIFIRDVIGGLLKVLNNKLVYQQVWNDASNGIENITIPFYYDIGNVTSERFLQDNYITFGTQCGFKKINGNFDMIPRGIITTDSVEIQADTITNRKVLGEYQKEDPLDGKIKTYVSYLYSIPLKMTFTCEIRSSSFTEMLKINQACTEFFYKNKTFYINHKGMKIGCRVGFPENYLAEKNTGFTMGGSDAADKLNLKQTFTLEVESHQPVFDPTTERLKTNKLKTFIPNIEIEHKEIIPHLQDSEHLTVSLLNDGDFYGSAPYYYDFTYLTKTDKDGNYHIIDTGYNGNSGNRTVNKKLDTSVSEIEKIIASKKDASIINSEFNLIYLIDDYKDYSLFPSDAILKLRWQYRKHNGDINTIKIEFEDSSITDVSIESENKKEIIAIIDNKLEYDWYIPKSFTGFEGTDLIILNSETVTVYREPVIKVIPHPITKKITEESIFCLDPGYFTCSNQGEEWDKKEKKPNGGFSYYTHITAELDYKAKNGKIKQLELILPIKDNKIEVKDDNNKINFERVMDTSINIDYTGGIPYRKGNLTISDAGNSGIFTTIPNIYIV